MRFLVLLIALAPTVRAVAPSHAPTTTPNVAVPTSPAAVPPDDAGESTDETDPPDVSGCGTTNVGVQS